MFSHASQILNLPICKTQSLHTPSLILFFWNIYVFSTALVLIWPQIVKTFAIRGISNQETNPFIAVAAGKLNTCTATSCAMSTKAIKKSLYWQNISIFSISLSKYWNKNTRRVSAITQLRKEGLGKYLRRWAEQSSHRRKPWSSCCPETAQEPLFPLSSSCPCEGFAFMKCPAIIQAICASI